MMSETNSDALQHIQARFGRHAREYVTSESHARGDDLRRLLAFSKPNGNWVMLDVATGGAHTALKVRPHVKTVIASDISVAMLKAARVHVAERNADGIIFVCTNAEFLPFASSTFDLVTCRIAAHHFTNAFGFLQASWRVLKDGARLVVQDHVLPGDATAGQYVDAFERLRDPTHNRAFTEQEWHAAFEDAGFRIEHSEIVLKRHHFASWAERQGCSQQTVKKLVASIANAPEAAVRWLTPRDFGEPEASFVNRHIIIAGHKRVIG